MHIRARMGGMEGVQFMEWLFHMCIC